jgi:hypothetical protein
MSRSTHPAILKEIPLHILELFSFFHHIFKILNTSSLVSIGLILSEEKIFEKFTTYDDDGHQVMAIAKNCE